MVLLRAMGRKRCEASHEKVEAWERDQVYGNLAEIAIKLPRKAEARGDTAHCRAHEMVQITIRRRSQLEGTEADILERFIVQQHALIGILH